MSVGQSKKTKRGPCPLTRKPGWTDSESNSAPLGPRPRTQPVFQTRRLERSLGQRRPLPTAQAPSHGAGGPAQCGPADWARTGGRRPRERRTNRQTGGCPAGPGGPQAPGRHQRAARRPGGESTGRGFRGGGGRIIVPSRAGPDLFSSCEISYNGSLYKPANTVSTTNSDSMSSDNSIKAHFSGLWIGEARPADEFGDVAVCSTRSCRRAHLNRHRS
jgi:hypothetical protein